MKKYILMPVFASLAFTAPVHANAFLNACSRFLMTSAGIGAGAAYTAHNYPNAVKLLGDLRSPAAPAPVPAQPQNDMIAQTIQKQNERIFQTMQAQSESFGKTLESLKGQEPSFLKELGKSVFPFMVKAGTVALAAWVAYDLTFGNGYTRKLLRAAEKRAKRFRAYVSDQFKTIHENAEKMFQRLLGLERKVDNMADHTEENTRILRALAMLQLDNTNPQNRRQLKQAIEQSRNGAEIARAAATAEGQAQALQTIQQWQEEPEADQAAHEEEQQSPPSFSDRARASFLRWLGGA